MKKFFGVWFWVLLGLGVLIAVVSQFDFLTAKSREVREWRESQELLPRIGREVPMGEGGGSNEEVLRKKVEASSAIAFSEIQYVGGVRRKVIVEMFPLSKGIECHYAVGDVLGNTVEGVAAFRSVHFFRGDPAVPREAMTIHSGFLLKQKDLPEAWLRKLIAEAAAMERPVPGYPLVTKFSELDESLEATLAKSDFVILAETRIERGYVRHYATHVFPLTDRKMELPSVGERVGDDSIREMGVDYGQGSWLFGRDAWIPRTISVHGGRLSSFGDIKEEVALERLENFLKRQGKEGQKKIAVPQSEE